MPSVSDTLTKVIGTHTLKAGFFYEWIRNAQPANNNTNGYLQFIPTNNVNFTTGNAYADMLEGNLSQVNQANFNRINDISYNTYEGFIQDSWKLTPKLTIDAGVRMTHFTPWADDEGYGYSVFNSSAYQGVGCTGSSKLLRVQLALQRRRGPSRRDSHRAHSSGSPVLGWPTICAAMAVPLFAADGADSITTPASLLAA